MGAATINYPALFDAVATHPGVTVAGIASRSIQKAETQISQYGLTDTARAYGSYDELLAESDIDAIYLPLPNSLHCEWAIKSMKAGKHVLIEKPIASNASEVEQIRQTAESTGKVALEAMHWRFHPAAHAVRSLRDKYGPIESISTRMSLPEGALKSDDIRFRYGLAGGACMDLSYVFSACCYFASDDIEQCQFEVLEAKAKPHDSDKEVDEKMTSTFLIKHPDKPSIRCNIEADENRRLKKFFGLIPDIMDIVPPLTIELKGARIDFPNFPGPWVLCRITVTEKNPDGTLSNTIHREQCYVGGPQWKDRGARFWTSHRYQLEAFIEFIRCKSSGSKYEGPWMTLSESAKLMGLIDFVYEKAELPVRGKQQNNSATVG